nr:ABC transporter permease [Granulicella aggregans]
MPQSGSVPIPWVTLKNLGIAPTSDVGFAAYSQPIHLTLDVGDHREVATVAGTTPSLFTQFTEPLSRGSTFTFIDNSVAGADEAIMSMKMASRIFGSPSSAIQKLIILNGRTLRVIGVAPASFQGFWEPTDLWLTPYTFALLDLGLSRTGNASASSGDVMLDKHWDEYPVFFVLAESHVHNAAILRSLVMSRVARLPSNTLPLEVSDGVTRDPLKDHELYVWARMMLIMSSLLLAVVCCNVCGILLAEVPIRREELRLRQVLGASPLRLFVEELTRPGLIIGSGLVAGCVMYSVAVTSLIRREGDLLGHTGVTLFALVAGVIASSGLIGVCGLVAAMIPAVRLLKDTGLPRPSTTSTESKVSRTFIILLVVLEVSCAVMALTVSGQLALAVSATANQDVGFAVDGLTTVEMGPAQGSSGFTFITSGEKSFPLQRLAASVISDGLRIPGVQSVSASSCAPLGLSMKTIIINPSESPGSDERAVSYCVVSRTFFSTLENTLVRGRLFTDDVMTGEASEVVLNQKLADTLFGGSDPIGRTVMLHHPVWDLEVSARVIGISRDLRFAGGAESATPSVFLPLRGNLFTLATPLYFTFRGGAGPRQARQLVDDVAARTMPNVAAVRVAEVREELIQRERPQYLRVLFTFIGAVMTGGVSAVGLYGLLLHMVRSRRREIAIRMCFGLTRGKANLMLIKQSLIIAIAGGLTGILGARIIVVTYVHRTIGIDVWSTYCALFVTVTAIAGALLLSIVPAIEMRRAQPSELLRGE